MSVPSRSYMGHNEEINKRMGDNMQDPNEQLKATESNEKALKTATAVGKFMQEKLSEKKQRPFGLALREEQKIEDYDPALLFPPAIMERAGELASKMFNVFDPTGELRGRCSIIEGETPILIVFNRTLSSLLAVSWYAVAKGWDQELIGLLNDKAYENESARAVGAPVHTIINMGGYGDGK